MTDATTDTVEFRATILGQDNPILASGPARLYTTIHAGSFWPQTAEAGPKLPENVATLLSPDGSRYALRNFHACPAAHDKGISHYDFDYDSV